MRPYLTGSIAALAIASGLLAQLPTWWQPRGVFSTQSPKDDYALANQGQLKNLTQATAAEMNLILPGGAGPTLNALIASWSPPNPQSDNFAVATSGQLKHVTRLFFQRLEDERLARFPNWPSNLPPWFQASPVSDDFAPINLGQLKAAFAILEGKGFSQAVSSNSLASLSSSQFGLGWFTDSDADSYADIAEFTQNGHPTNPLIQPVPTLRILSGNRQLIPPATIALAPLRVIAERGWTPQANLSVTFNALAGLTSTTQAGPWLSSQTITTATDGTAQIHWQSGSTSAPDEVSVTLPPPSGPPIVFGLNPPIGPPGGGGNGSGNPQPPVSPPPSTFHVFTSIRIKTASFSGAIGTECRQDTEITETWIEDNYASSSPRPTDDGFDGDADLNQNPTDPGDPRDLNLQHLFNTSPNIIEKGVDPDSPGAYPLDPYMEESVVTLETYSSFTLPNKGYYSADDAFLSTPPSTQDGSPTYTSGVLTSMLAATLWGPNLHTGWMGNGRNGISSQSASAVWYSYTWSGSCGTPEPPVDPPEDPPTDPEGEPCCGGSSTSSGGTVTTVSGSGTSVGANHTQVRLQCSHTVTDPAGISRTFLLIQTRTNFTTKGQISGQPIVTILGTATLTIPQGHKISTQVSGSASLTYLRNLGGIAYVEMAPPPTIPNTRIELKLTPIDLDIIHPATGQLDEGREDDVTRGGYVAIRRDANTPVTKLALHASHGLPDTAKFKLKFSANDRYNLWKDEALTQPVLSEQTEFPMKTSSTVYVEGIKRSTARSAEQITMQIDVNASVSHGDSVRFTVVQSEFYLMIRAFIPHAWTAGEAPIDPLNWNIVAGGDDRTFSTQRQASARITQAGVLTPYRDLHDKMDRVDLREEKAADLSKHYDKSEDVPPEDRSRNFGQTLIGTPNVTGAPSINRDREPFFYGQERLNDVSMKMKFYFAGSDGAMAWYIPLAVVPDIDWGCLFSLDCSNPVMPRLRSLGAHNLYPAYEILVEQTDGKLYHVWEYMPSDAILPGPNSLNTETGFDETVFPQ